MTARSVLLVALAAACAGGCSFFRGIGLAPTEVDPAAVVRPTTADEPARVVVQHVLVSFEGTRVTAATRSKDEARSLAQRVLDDARSGRDFDELVRLFSDDRGNDGKIALANWGAPPEGDEIERRKAARGFGALAFKLAVGEIGLVEYDVNASPYGWHVMKRLK